MRRPSLSRLGGPVFARRGRPHPLEQAEPEASLADTDSAHEDGDRFDVIAFAVEQAERRARPRELPRLLMRAITLTYRAAPRQLILTVVLAIGSALLAAAQVLIGAHALQGLIQVDQGKASVSSALRPFLFVALLAGLSGVLTVVASQLERMLGERTQRRTVREVIAACISLDLEAYDDPAFFDQLQRVMTNAVPRPVSVAHGVIGIARGIVGAITIGAVLVTLAPALLPVILLVSVPLTLTSRRGSRSEFRFAVDQASGVRKRYYLQDVMTGRPAAKEVRAFGLGPELLRRWDLLYDEYFEGLRAQVLRRLRLTLVGRIGATLCGVLAIVLLLVLVSHHQISLASAGAAGLALMLLSARVEAMAGGGATLYESGLFLQDLEDFLQMAEAHRSARRTEVAPPEFQELRTHGLGFRYPGSNVAALSDIDFSIQRGEVVALVGENGSGKTTLAKLLADLYRPTEGWISWDGSDVSAMDPDSVREAVAVIFQDFLMYALPASENIGVGRPNAIDDLDAIVTAAKQSGAHEFLSRLPNGYDNYLSKLFEGGRDLSLGQWQRVALARAFYRNAPFIILDEPSSALDPRAEADLFSRIRTLLGGRTVLLISHRFSSVRSADRIYVMNEGQIVEHGTHDELMDLEGLYAELFTLQADAYLTAERP
jgi:ATP-binding cassette, subfamily B, bacterial